MQLLLNDELAPITSEIGFLEADCSRVEQAFVQWQRSIHQPRGLSIVERPVSGTLREVLLTLLPLTSVEWRRVLFVPTRSPWTGYFDNGHQGSDAATVASYLAKQVGCRGLRVAAVPDTIEGEFRTARGRYGALIFELYGPEDTDFLNYIRSISLAHDGNRWAFDVAGQPLTFENLERYKTPSIRNRFTFEMLNDYLGALGLSPFDEDFYLPKKDPTATLLEKVGPTVSALREFSLAEARMNY